MKRRILYCAEGVLLVGAVDFLFYRSLAVFLFASPLALLWMRLRQKSRREAEKKEMLYAFREALGSLLVSIRAGYSAENAFREAERDLAASLGEKHAMTRAFAQMNRRIALHESAEDVFTEFAERSGVEDIRDFAEVFRTAKRTGGNFAEILSGAARLIGDKIRVEREIEAAVAAKKFEQRIMAVMPCGIILYMRFASPGFLDILYGSMTGAVIMTGCLAVCLLSFLLGKRIVNIQV